MSNMDLRYILAGIKFNDYQLAVIKLIMAKAMTQDAWADIHSSASKKEEHENLMFLVVNVIVESYQKAQKEKKATCFDNVMPEIVARMQEYINS